MSNSAGGRSLCNFHTSICRSFAIAFCYLCFATSLAFAQSYPTFSGGAQASPVQQTNVSPAAIVFGGVLRIYYTGTGGNAIWEATSTGGSGSSFPVTLIGPVADTATSSSTGPAAIVYNNQVWLAWVSSGLIYYCYSSDGIHFGTPVEWPAQLTDANNNGDAVDAPSFGVFNGNLYLAETAATVNGFPQTAYLGVYPNSYWTYWNYSYPAQAGSSLTVFNGQLWMAWTLQTNDADTVVLANTSNGTNFTVSEAPLTLGGNPQLFVYNSSLYVGGRTNYNDNNLWISQYYGGSWTSGKQYGQTLTQSPSFTVFNGTLYEIEKSCCNQDIWGYY